MAQAAKNPAFNYTVTKETMDKIAFSLRNDKGLIPYDGACNQRRCEFFKGDELLDFFMSKYFMKKKFFPDLKDTLSIAEATHLSQLLLNQRDYFSRCKVVNEDRAIDELIVLQPMMGTPTFMGTEDDVYLWNIETSRRKALLYSMLFVVGCIAMAAIKAWPIWMKISVYWVSLICLICLVAVSLLRYALYSIFWIFGFRGIWLFPNMYNDDLDFLDAWEPMWGKMVSTKENAKIAKDRRLEKIANEMKKKEAEKIAKKKEVGNLESLSEERLKEIKDLEEEGKNKRGRCADYNFGLLNLCLIFIIGLVSTHYMGLFVADNIPDFVVSKKELFETYPSLAPPDYNASADINAPPLLDDLETLEREAREEQEEKERRESQYSSFTQTEELTEDAPDVLDEVE